MKKIIILSSKFSLRDIFAALPLKKKIDEAIENALSTDLNGKSGYSSLSSLG
jgi:hypothetical protein